MNSNANHTLVKAIDVQPRYSASPEGWQEKDGNRAQTRRIIVLSRKGRFDTSVMEHALNIAERLGLDLVPVYINPLPELSGEKSGKRQFEDAAKENAAFFKAKGREHNVQVAPIITHGKVVDTVKEICRSLRRVEFVMVEPEIRVEDLALKLSVPVFSMILNSKIDPGDQVTDSSRWNKWPHHHWGVSESISHSHQRDGGKLMVKTENRKKELRKMILFGAASLALYGAVFAFADPIMAITTKGGFFAVAPVVTVFLFSYIHGNFASKFWSFLGIEASKTVVIKRVEKTVRPAKRKDVRPRARLSV